MSSNGMKKRTIKFRKPRVCSLPHCRAKRGKDISLFCFPKDEVLRQEWAKELKFEKEIAKYSFVCSQHFDEKDLISRPDGEWLRRRLRKGALPSHNLPEFPIVDGSKKKIPELDAPDAAMSRNSKNSPIVSSFRATNREEKKEECRVCLRPTLQSCTTNIFKKWTPNFLKIPSTIAAELGKLANVEIVEDAHSKLICDSCFFLFRRSLKFVIDVRNSENVLKSRYIQLEVPPSPNRTWPQPIQLEKNINEEVLGKTAEVEIKQEVMSEDEYEPFNADEEDRQDTQMDIKVEPEEITAPSLPIKVTVNGAGEVVLSSDEEVIASNYEETDPLGLQKEKKKKEIPVRDIGDADFKEFYQKRKFKKISKSILPPCNCKTKYKCTENITQTHRQNIHKYYSNLKNAFEEISFVLKFTEKLTPKKKTRNNLKHRDKTIKYYLPQDKDVIDASKKVPVCKKMFLNTIVGSNSFVGHIWMIYDKIVKARKRVCRTKSIKKYKAGTSRCEKVVDLTETTTDSEDLTMKSETAVNIKNLTRQLRISITKLDPLLYNKAPCQATRDNVSKQNVKEKYSVICDKNDSLITNTNDREQSRPRRSVCSCENNCTSKLPDEHRRRISNYYRYLSAQKQKEFLLHFTKRQCQQRHKKETIFTYYLPKTQHFENRETEKINVCLTTFKKTIPFKQDLNKIWKKYDIQCRQKIKLLHSDVVESVCKHFKILQERKVKLMKDIALGLKANAIERLTFAKMYKLYAKWIVSTKYTNIAKSLGEYKKVVIRNIPRDHILTLQQKKTRAPKELKTEKLEKGSESQNNCTIEYSDGTSQVLNHVKVKDVIMEHTPGVEAFSKEDLSNNEHLSDNDLPDYDSDHSNISNFSSEFKDKVSDTKSKEDSVGYKKELNNEDESSSDESDTIDIADIKNEVVSKKSTRNNPVGELVGGPVDVNALKIECLQNMELLLTGKKKLPTRDSGVIRKYYKYHGLPYVDLNGKLVPKKTLGPPCKCQKKCGKKVSQEQRQYIFDRFYALGTKQKQIEFALQLTERIFVSTDKGVKPKVKHFLPLSDNFESGERVYVCSTMFNNTVAQNSISHRAWVQHDKEHPVTKPPIANLKRKRHDVGEDNTLIDFVYRAMPFDEYMVHFATKKEINIDNDNSDSNLVASESEPQKKAKKKPRTIRKELRLQGKRYIDTSGKIVGERIIGPPCNCSMLKCSDKVSDEQRKHIFKYYWSLLDMSLKWAFIVRFTERVDVKRLRPGVKFNRDHQIWYYLPLTTDFDGEKLRVCKIMFKRTLGIGPGVIKIAWQKYVKGSFMETRGNHKNHPKLTFDDDMVTSVLDHFNYLKETDELKKFTCKGKNETSYYQFRNMYKLYVEWFDPNKYTSKVKTARHYKIIILGQHAQYMKTNRDHDDTTATA